MADPSSPQGNRPYGCAPRRSSWQGRRNLTSDDLALAVLWALVLLGLLALAALCIPALLGLAKGL